MTTIRVPSSTTGEDLVVHVEGDGPAMVFLHGLLGSAQEAREQAPPGFRVACFDQRGHGDGPRPRDAREYAIERFVEDVGRVLDALAAAEPGGGPWAHPIVAGTSMGSAVALAFALAHPDRLGALVLVGPAFGDRPSAAVPRFDAMADGLQTLPLEGFLARVRLSLQEQGLPWQAITDPDMWRRHDLAALAVAVATVGHWVPFPNLRAVADLSLPVTVVAWPDDEMHPLLLAEQIAACAGTAVHLLAGVAMVLEDPEATSAAIATAVAAERNRTDA